ncbi:MAG: SDR family oxidoreductase [Candidatus Bathyarchaeota archaeon]|jgi:UDP-glucose 4-epimerase
MSNTYSRILVTGGAGFIGSHIVDQLLTENYEVTVLDNLESGRLKNITHNNERPEFTFTKGDIRDYELVRQLVKDVDVVFHQAALVGIPLSVKTPILTNDVNVLGTLNLLKASTDLNVQRFIHASSAAVYGDTPNPRKMEDMTLIPESPYGVSKIAAENYVDTFYKTYGLRTTSFRYFNVYGPRQRVDTSASYGGVINIFIERLLKNMPPLIHGDGEQTRDFVYIKDVVNANISAMNNTSAVGETFNIGTGTETSINTIAETLKQIMNKRELKNIHSDPRPNDIRQGHADITKARKILGYKPEYSLKDGLTDLVNWYK